MNQGREWESEHGGPERWSRSGSRGSEQGGYGRNEPRWRESEQDDDENREQRGARPSSRESWRSESERGQAARHRQGSSTGWGRSSSSYGDEGRESGRYGDGGRRGEFGEGRGRSGYADPRMYGGQEGPYIEEQGPYRDEEREEYGRYSRGSYGGGHRRDYGSDPGRESGGGYGSGYRGSSSTWRGRGHGGSEYGSFGSRHAERDFSREFGESSFGDEGGGGRESSRGSRGGFGGSAGYAGSSPGYSRYGGRSEMYGGSYGGHGGESGRGPQTAQHRGKGPKGYQRSDERIREEVCERLKEHPDLDATDIEVEVSSGEVTLKGEVADRREKRMAEDCAEEVSGVTEVTNQLRKRGDQQERQGDAERTITPTRASTSSSGASAQQRPRSSGGSVSSST